MQPLVKRRWAPLDALKRVATQFLKLFEQECALMMKPKKLFGCTPPTDPNVQGRPKYIFFVKTIKKCKFSSQNCISQNFKA